jgi:hypothetical protein
LWCGRFKITFCWKRFQSLGCNWWQILWCWWSNKAGSRCGGWAWLTQSSHRRWNFNGRTTKLTQHFKTDISQIDFTVCGELTAGFGQAAASHTNANRASTPSDFLGQRPGLEQLVSTGSNLYSISSATQFTSRIF